MQIPTSKAFAPFLFEDLHNLIRNLMSRCIKPDVLKQASTVMQLLKVDVKSTLSLLSREKVGIGFAAVKLLKQCKATKM